MKNALWLPSNDIFEVASAAAPPPYCYFLFSSFLFLFSLTKSWNRGSESGMGGWNPCFRRVTPVTRSGPAKTWGRGWHQVMGGQST